MAAENDGATGTLLPPAPRLTSLKAVRREMGRVYTEARQGRLPTEEATRLTYILRCMREILEAELIEERVAALEKRTQSLPEPPAPLRLVRRA